MINGVLSVLVWLIVLVTLMKLWMAHVVASIFIKAVVVLLFVAVSRRIVE